MMIPQRYKQYAQDVVSGKIAASKYIMLACKRYLDWFNDPTKYFDADKIQRIEDFLKHISHFEGEFAAVPFSESLLDWQLWCLCNIFGWYRADDHSKRVIRNVFLLISRKNGKTGLSAAIMLADMIIGGEAGYEGYLVANNREQAKVAFKFIKGFCCSIDPKHRHLKVYRDYITYDKTNSRIKVLSSDAMGNDGYNPSSFIWDETAAAKDFSNFNILKSGQAMRKNPLSISISSAGFLLDGYPCYEQCKIGQRVLQGELTDDSTFYAIYQLDEEDDYTDEKNWVKACPSYPNIVQRDYMEERVREAQQNTAKMVDVKTKNFNIWCSSSNVWIPTAVLAKCHQVIDLEKLRSEPCYVGFDLSSTRDLTALTVMFPPNPYRTYMPDKFLFKNYCWIPQDAVRNSEQSTLYQWFIENGFAEMTAGNSVDYDAVFNKLKEIASMFTLVKVSYDQWNASMMVQRCIGEGFPMEPFHQGLGSFNRPTKSLEILVFNQQCCFDCNQLIMWMFGHAELKIDHMNNVKPIKANDDKKNKIDCIIAMLESLGGYLLDYVANNMNVVNLNF